VIAVAATDRNDNLADFSHYGRNSVHLAAPGVDIYSCFNSSDSAYATE
jgi:subtilisin family serine protease